MDKIRCFLAVDFGSFFAGEISSVMQALGRQNLNVRWIKPDEAHLTLHFLGELPFPKVEGLCRAIAQPIRQIPSFDLKLAGFGAFPDLRHPRVLWLGLAGAVNTLKGLKTVLDSPLEEAGIPVEKRPYEPHLTLGRFRIPSRRPVEVPSAMQQYAGERAFTVREVVLFRSQLLPGGPHYTPIETFPLKGETHEP